MSVTLVALELLVWPRSTTFLIHRDRSSRPSRIVINFERDNRQFTRLFLEGSHYVNETASRKPSYKQAVFSFVSLCSFAFMPPHVASTAPTVYTATIEIGGTFPFLTFLHSALFSSFRISSIFRADFRRLASGARACAERFSEKVHLGIYSRVGTAFFGIHLLQVTTNAVRFVCSMSTDVHCVLTEWEMVIHTLLAQLRGRPLTCDQRWQRSRVYWSPLSFFFPSIQSTSTQYPRPSCIKVWEDNVKKCPDVRSPQIIYYLLHTKACDLEDVKAYKSLDSYNYFKSGWVGAVLVHEVYATTVLLKGTVQGSQSINRTNDVWVCAKMDGTLPDNALATLPNNTFRGNASTRHGQAYEPVAREEFGKETGLVASPCGTVVCAEETWLSATPDGIIESHDAMLEIKCPKVENCKEKISTGKYDFHNKRRFRTI
ncbi:hypothetical protein HPB47_017248 [Ixodes persulcatus]|uniref:Uncharacterized protein n=1 Tax=Ixodes persulcatus TaxID=34615 RepID=A0AC60QSD2_IXOPE|nr:hypothetical protein HPB47_017248 [Ixodes persulcatus]